jgi:hypothetical protein
MWGPISLLIGGLVAVGLIAGIQQSTWLDNWLNDAPGGTIAVWAGVACFGMLSVLFATQLILSAILPTPAYHPMSEREGRLGGILIAIPLLIGIATFWMGDAEKSPLYIPAMMLSTVGVSAAFWFLVFCIGHLLAQSVPALVKVLGVVALILGSLVVLPLYWYAFVWRPHLTHPSRCEK